MSEQEYVHNFELEHALNIQKDFSKHVFYKTLRNNCMLIFHTLKLLIPTAILIGTLYYIGHINKFINHIYIDHYISFFFHIYIAFYKSKKKIINLVYTFTFFLDIFINSLLDKYFIFYNDIIYSFRLPLIHIINDFLFNALIKNKNKISDFLHILLLYLVFFSNNFLAYDFEYYFPESKRLILLNKVVFIPILQIIFRFFITKFVTTQIASKIEEKDYHDLTFAVICREIEFIILWPIKVLLFLEKDYHTFIILLLSNSIFAIISKLGWYLWHSCGPFVLPIFFQPKDINSYVKKIDSILQREISDKLLQYMLPFVIFVINNHEHMFYSRLLMVILLEEFGCIIFIYIVFKKGYNIYYSKLFTTFPSSIKILVLTIINLLFIIKK